MPRGRITYEEIPKFCDSVDRTQPPSVRLNRWQARLYRELLRSPKSEHSVLLRLSSKLRFGLAMLLVLLTARHLLLLAYFHHHDVHSLSAIRFLPMDDGYVEVVFRRS
jgi:hypothetical protein